MCLLDQNPIKSRGLLFANQGAWWNPFVDPGLSGCPTYYAQARSPAQALLAAAYRDNLCVATQTMQIMAMHTYVRTFYGVKREIRLPKPPYAHYTMRRTISVTKRYRSTRSGPSRTQHTHTDPERGRRYESTVFMLAVAGVKNAGCTAALPC